MFWGLLFVSPEKEVSNITKQNAAFRFTDEEMETAKGTDLPDLLEHLGFIDSGLLYEDSLHHNCVFVGRDTGGKAVFASKRGTYDLNGSGFKADADGPGQEATEKLRAEYGQKGYDVSTRTPAQGKDWNAYLQQRGHAGERGDQRQSIAR